MVRTNRRLFFGLLLVILGVLLLLANLGLLPFSWNLAWPLALAALGLWWMAGSARRPAGRGLPAGLLAFAIGAFWFAEQLGWVRQDLFLGVLLVAFGLGLAVQALAGPRA